MTPTLWKFVVFVAAIAVLIIVSRRSLTSPRHHGFPRFLLFVLVVALVLLNVEHWFRSPFAPLQLVSWALLFGSIPVLVAGVTAIRRHGRPGERAAEDANYSWENTAHLVQSGIYRYIRHPFYASLLMLVWGAFLKDPSIVGLTIAAAATASGFATAIIEEGENVKTFGDEYVAYMRRTHRFVPFVV